MGTSSFHYGPKRSPLLPDDFDDPGSGGSDSPLLPPEQLPDAPPQEGDSLIEYQPDISWGGAKRTMGRFASGNLNGGARKVASAYVKAAGGARNAKMLLGRVLKRLEILYRSLVVFPVRM